MVSVKILFIGDVVGSPGRKMVQEYVPKLKEVYKPQITIVNGENAASGEGITENIYKQFMPRGIQVDTIWNHTGNKHGISAYIDNATNLIRPAKCLPTTRANCITYVTYNDLIVAVINLQGITYLGPIDDPFTKADQLIKDAK